MLRTADDGGSCAAQRSCRRVHPILLQFGDCSKDYRHGAMRARRPQSQAAASQSRHPTDVAPAGLARRFEDQGKFVRPRARLPRQGAVHPPPQRHQIPLHRDLRRANRRVLHAWKAAVPQRRPRTRRSTITADRGGSQGDSAARPVRRSRESSARFGGAASERRRATPSHALRARARKPPLAARR